MSTFDCPLCNQKVASLMFISHIPSCYYSFATKNGFTPFCTCSQCKGLATHPGHVQISESTYQISNKRKAIVVPLHSNSVEAMDSSNRSLLDDSISIGTELPTERLLGKKCIMCGENPKAKLPSIFIGKYIIFRFCKKKHITEEEALLMKLIDQEHAKVKASNDAKPITWAFEHGSQEEAQSIPPRKSCSGYVNLEGLPCTNRTDDDYLSVDGKYYCKASHLVRALVQKKPSANSKKAKKGAKDSGED